MNETNDVKNQKPLSADEQSKVDKKKAERDARKKKLAEAKALVYKFSEGVKDETLKEALVLLSTQKASGARRTSVPSINQRLYEDLKAKGHMSELEIFKGYRIGRPEMTSKIRIFLKDADPKNWMWVRFDEEKEAYMVVGHGPKAPEGWDGFDPTKSAAL